MTDLYKAIVFPETSPSKIPQGAALRIVTKKTRPSSFRYCTSSSSLRSFRSFVTLVFLVLSTNLGKSPIGIPRSGVLLLLLFVSSYKRNVRNASTRGWLFFQSIIVSALNSQRYMHASRPGSVGYRNHYLHFCKSGTLDTGVLSDMSTLGISCKGLRDWERLFVLMMRHKI